MVVEKLGSNLESLMESSDGSFTVSTTMKLAVKLVRLPETIHTLPKWNQGQEWLCNLMCACVCVSEDRLQALQLVAEDYI